MDEILKIVLNCNKKRMLLSHRDVKRICKIIATNNNYEGCDCEFKIVNLTDEECGGEVDDSDNHIIFYDEGIDCMINSDYEYMTAYESLDGTKIDFLNFAYLSVIFHEMAHVRQFKLIKSRNKSMETQLYRICEKLMNIKEFYDENYTLMLNEVNAFSKGAIDSLSVYKKMPLEYLSQNDRVRYASFTLYNMINKYLVDGNKEIVTSPSELLLDSANRFNLTNYNIDIDKFEKLINEPNTSLYRKLINGLKISYQDYAYINLINSVMQSGQEIDFVKKLKK